MPKYTRQDRVVINASLKQINAWNTTKSKVTKKKSKVTKKKSKVTKKNGRHSYEFIPHLMDENTEYYPEDYTNFARYRTVINHVRTLLWSWYNIDGVHVQTSHGTKKIEGIDYEEAAMREDVLKVLLFTNNDEALSYFIDWIEDTPRMRSKFMKCTTKRQMIDLVWKYGIEEYKYNEKVWLLRRKKP